MVVDEGVEDIEVMSGDEIDIFQEYEGLSDYEQEEEEEVNERKNTHHWHPLTSDNTSAISFKAMVVHGIPVSNPWQRLYRQWKWKQVGEGWELGGSCHQRRGDANWSDLFL